MTPPTRTWVKTPDRPIHKVWNTDEGRYDWYLTAAQASDLIGITAGTFTVWKSQRRFDFFYIRSKNKLLYRLADIEKFLYNNFNYPWVQERMKNFGYPCLINVDVKEPRTTKSGKNVGVKKVKEDE